MGLSSRVKRQSEEKPTELPKIANEEVLLTEIRDLLKGTSKNPILRAAALRLACLPVSSQYGVTLKKLSLTYQLYAALKFFTCVLYCLET